MFWQTRASTGAAVSWLHHRRERNRSLPTTPLHSKITTLPQGLPLSYMFKATRTLLMVFYYHLGSVIALPGKVPCSPGKGGRQEGTDVCSSEHHLKRRAESCSTWHGEGGEMV